MTRPLALFLALACQLSAEGWPHWLGPHRDATTSELSGWAEGRKDWPSQTPLWEAQVGEGSSSVLVVENHLYTTGRRDGKEHVVALDAASGKVIWEQAYLAPKYGRHATGDQGFYSGPSATPEYDPETKLLYTMGIDGDLRAWRTDAGGAPLWSANLYDRYQMGRRPQVTERRNSHRDYGTPNTPRAYGDWLLVEVGSKKGFLAALDKRTGEERWTSDDQGPAGHSGGIALMDIDGVPCAVVLGALHVVVVRLDGDKAGQTVATIPWTTDFINNIPTPATAGDTLIVSTLYNVKETARFRVGLDGEVSKLWSSKEATGVCSPVVHKGHVYFAAQAGLRCLELDTGKKLWQDGKTSAASSILATADDRLIVWANNGDLLLVETATRSPDRYTELAARHGLHDAMAWPMPALAGGRLFLKTRDGRVSAWAVGGPAR